MKLVRKPHGERRGLHPVTEHDNGRGLRPCGPRLLVLNRGQVIASGCPPPIREDKARCKMCIWAAVRCTGGIMLTVSNINSFYGAAHILHDVSLTISQGEAVALLGRNGAGKIDVNEIDHRRCPAALGQYHVEGRK